jgi:hypothetical protein
MGENIIRPTPKNRTKKTYNFGLNPTQREPIRFNQKSKEIQVKIKGKKEEDLTKTRPESTP